VNTSPRLSGYELLLDRLSGLFPFPIKKDSFKSKPVLKLETARQSRQIDVQVHRPEKFFNISKAGVVTAFGAIYIREVTDFRNSGPALQIAAVTNRLNVERAVIVPMIVMTGGLAAINALTCLNGRQLSIKNGTIDHAHGDRTAPTNLFARAARATFPARSAEEFVIATPSQFLPVAQTAFKAGEAANLPATFSELAHLNGPRAKFFRLANSAARIRLNIILGLNVGDLAGLYLLLSVQLLKLNNQLVRWPCFADLSVLDFGDSGLRTFDRRGDLRLRHTKSLEFENDVLDVHMPIIGVPIQKAIGKPISFCIRIPII
jgi:hypothetical protein